MTDELKRLEQLDETDAQRATKREQFAELLGSIMGSIVEALPDALVVVNDEGIIVLVNAQTEFLFGYHRSELVDHKVEMLIPERVREKHEQHRGGYMERPTIRTMGANLQLSGRRKNGMEVPLEIMLSPMVTKLGVYSLAIIRRAVRDAGR